MNNLYFINFKNLNTLYIYLSEKNLKYTQHLLIKYIHLNTRTKKSRFLHSFVKEIISKQKGVNYHDIKIYINKLGKPMLDCGSYFSLSYSGDYAAIYIQNFNIGLDIEEINTSIIDKTLIHFVLSDKEIEYLTNSKEQDLCFFKLWTAKEAYLKYKGTGIINNLKKVDTLTLNKINLKYFKIHNCIVCVCSKNLINNIEVIYI